MTFLLWLVSRWQVEVTFQQVRAHLGLENQRQYDNASHAPRPVLDTGKQHEGAKLSINLSVTGGDAA